MKNYCTLIITPALKLGLFSVLSLFLISILAACSDSKKEFPHPGNKDLKDEAVSTDVLVTDSLVGQTGDNVTFSVPKQEGEKRYYKGRVVYLTNIFLGNYAPMEKDMLKLLASKGQPIVFLTGEGESGSIYFVFNKDNLPAVRMLAEYGDSKQVSIFGKVIILNGIKILIAEKIERIK